MMNQSFLQKYKYGLLFATYTVTTGAIFLRIWRQPYTWGIKAEQLESVFKGTTLGAVIIGVAISGKIDRPRSSALESTK